MVKSWTIPVVCLALITIISCLLLLCIACAGIAYYIYNYAQPMIDQSLSGQATPSSTPVVIRPDTQSPNIPPQTEPQAAPSGKVEASPNTNLLPAQVLQETYKSLSQTHVPMNDMIDLAWRLEGKRDIPLTQAAPEFPLQIGEQRFFWVSNTDTNENFQVLATLRYITDHAYFWIQNETRYDEDDLQALADTFEHKIYPTNRAFFGSEWTPGVDNDPHIYILYAQGLGDSIAGYFSSIDSLPPTVHEYSNWHEMFLFNADNISLDDEFTYGVLAHEFQHMIHWYRDRNEDTWMNEGFSDLAMLLNDYGIGGHDYMYALNPDLQLNDWPTDQNATTPHYGASFLFTTYFLDRMGKQATQKLVEEKENGLQSIDVLLQKLELTDNISRNLLQADDLFIDWVLASYLQDDQISDGRYSYLSYPQAPQPKPSETITDCPTEYQTRSVHQYGVDYIQIRCENDLTLHFEGSMQVGVLPVDPLSGSYVFWSNKGDESDMTLTRSFDFSDISGEISLSYWTWYDIEQDFDYVYLEASTDGESWQILSTPSGTAEDPTGNNFGWAYNGLSGEGEELAEWIQETLDLSQFAGKEVQLRFEYVTDAAVNGEGFLIDDIAIPEINYFSDFENDESGWEGNGFVRIQNALPQYFRLALISIADQTTVEYLTLNEALTVEIPLTFDNELREAILVVTGTTRFTRQPAAYRFYFTP